MFVRPREGRTVRHPFTMVFLPAEGATVERDAYWMRRLIEGDVEECDPTADAVEDENKGAAL